jgi:SAM-dependent methyltransferase
MFHPIRKIYYALPVQLRFLCRRLLYWPLDLLTHTNRKKKILPPAGLLFIGSGDFELTGNRFAQRLKEYAHLHAGSRVLDIGCGIGRLARPLTDILQPPGIYKGFDVVKTGIDWCNKNIAVRYPHFEFAHVSLSNDLYNNQGENAAEFTFPYTNNSFTVVAAISVYTHLLPHETKQYLAESARVMESGGIAFFTFFIHDEQTQLPRNFDFPVKREGYALMDERVSRANVLYNRSFLFEMIAQQGLEIKEWVRGRWIDPLGSDLQDTLVLTKK